MKEKLKPYPPILERRLVRVNETSDFRIMQWNMLARALCSKDEHSRAPDDAYDWRAFRLWRTLEELIRHHADIICLEEADSYEEIKPFMHSLGYSSIFMPKFKSPCLEMKPNVGPDGLCVFYKRSKFQLINMSCEKIVTDSEINGQVFIIMHLKHRLTQTPLTVVCVHLKAKVQNEEKRTQQIGEILKSLVQHLYGIDKELERHAVVMCGDFNGEPFEKFHELVLKVNELNLNDAYSLLNGPKQPTTIKFKGDGGSLLRRAIDYVFFTQRNLTLAGYLELPTNDLLINEQGLPNLAFSSDHLSLVCDFKFNLPKLE